MTKNITLFKIFGANLRKYRNQKGLSQRAIFHLCGIDHGMISRMENGKINVTLSTLSILATSLDVSCWELLFSTGDLVPQERTSIES
jgi:transcriptional regulator with XRE-family HTH domain